MGDLTEWILNEEVTHLKGKIPYVYLSRIFCQTQRGTYSLLTFSMLYVKLSNYAVGH